MLASPPGFSQPATSFIASQCQGIHQMPFSLRLITASPSPAMPHHRRAQGQTPCRAPQPRGPAASHEDTSLGQTRCKRRSPRPVRLGHTQLSLHPSISPPRSPRGAVAQSSPSRAPPVRSPPLPCGAAGGRDRPATPGAAGGGGERIRTDDLLLAKQALSQLSYTPRTGVRARPGNSRGAGIRQQKFPIPDYRSRNGGPGRI